MSKKKLTPAQQRFYDEHIDMHTNLLTFKEARNKCLALLDIKPKKEK
jgi:hypothetical protein